MSNEHSTRTAGTRPDKHDFDTLSGNTWFVHGGNHADETTAPSAPPS